ncbi:MAG: DUF411 domain-containing protein [Bordetella sp.]|nr:DUF411 domain-containing protein [Bordetella sp.]
MTPPSRPSPLRRQFLRGAGSLALLAPLAALAPARALAQQAVNRRVEVWKTPSCGCCGDWVAHLEEAGFRVTVRDVADTGPVRARLGVAPRYGSCHTGLVGGYALEGHVPAQDILALLAQSPAGAGLAVPGMPVGSPGMDGEVYGGRRDDYDVLLVQRDGSARVWRAVRGGA